MLFINKSSKGVSKNAWLAVVLRYKYDNQIFHGGYPGT